MSKFELTILGSNSAMPAYGRFPTSQVLNINENLILLDCGEGSQIRMSQYKIQRNKINYILISHMHGDHIYGLPGFIGSLAHTSRQKPLHVIGPVGIRSYIETCLSLSQAHLNYELSFKEISVTEKVKLSENNDFELWSFPVFHRIPTYGYHVIEKKQDRNILKSAIAEYDLSIDEIKSIKKGNDLIRGKIVVANSELTVPRQELRDYAFCGDSKLDDRLLDYLKGVKNLYFETTYLHELAEKAKERGHATAKEAGWLANKLKVNNLIIGHYSSRYKSLQSLHDEASKEFKNVHLGYDGFIMNF